MTPSPSFFPSVNDTTSGVFKPLDSGARECSAARNACKLCTPLGASMVFAGIKNCASIMHGSQGCATYIRRYMISHFREPADIASSSFSEEDAVFGGRKNLMAGLENLRKQYMPSLIGISTTCLSETIGEDIPAILHEYKSIAEGELPPLVHVSTPSYSGTHTDGFHDTVLALVKHFAEAGEQTEKINLFPGMVSPEDLRWLKDLCSDMNLSAVLAPDYSETLDGGNWSEYHRIPEGGTRVEDLRLCGRARATLELGHGLFKRKKSAGKFLKQNFGISLYSVGLPIGLRLTDKFMKVLESVSGRPCPYREANARDRLVDAMVDGHKYLAGKNAVLYGEADLVVALASFVSELGIQPVICATGSKGGQFRESILEAVRENMPKLEPVVLDASDHAKIGEEAKRIRPDFLLGSSKGFPISRYLGVPLVRVGFPVHDRVGGARILHLGYSGALRLFDEITNTLMERRQDNSEVGYSYL